MWNFVLGMCSGKAVGALQGHMWSVCLISESKELLLFCFEGWIARMRDLPIRSRLHLKPSARINVEIPVLLLPSLREESGSCGCFDT